MDVQAMMIQKLAQNFVVAFMIKANRFTNVWPSIIKQKQKESDNRRVGNTPEPLIGVAPGTAACFISPEMLLVIFAD